jgi:hypothetical protein
MKNTDNHRSFELEQYLEDGDILYSHKDKQYFRLALDAVINHSMGLAVIGVNEAALTHYSRILTSRLRKKRTFQIENFPPTNTEELLQKFNQLLSQMTMDQARQKPSADKPITLMLVNDANAVDPAQWTLLLQLLSDFPGINVRMVLFFNKARWPAYDETLMPLGRNLYRWDIETPSVLEAKEFFSAVQGTIYEREAALFLNNVGLGEVVKDEKILREEEQLLLPGQQSQVMKETQNDTPREAHIFKEKSVGIKHKSGKQQRLLRGLIMVGIFGAAAFGFSYTIMGEYKGLSTSVTGELKNYVQNKILTPPFFLTAEEIEAIVPDQVDQTAREQNASSDDHYRTVIANAGSQSELVVSQIHGAIENIPPARENTEREYENADNKTEQNSLQPLKRLPKQTFFVQHIVLESEQSIVDYMTQFPALSGAQILPIIAKGNKSIGLISGPFSSRGEAAEFAAGPGIPEGFWLREAEQLEVWCQRNQACNF